MNGFFSTITMENGGYIGTVFNSSTNQQVYQTQPHPSQLLATRDMNNFIKRGQTNISTTDAVPTTQTTTPTVYSSPKRCCGR
jgi:hypothetical protein